MTIKVLSIDGGGIRGVGPAYILTVIEKRLREEHRKGIAESFDLFVGTSTGCIIAAALAASGQVAGDLSPAGILDLYHEHGAEMFVKPKALNPFGLLRGRYRERRKGEVIRRFLGDITLGNINRNFLGTFYNLGDTPTAGPVFANGGERYRHISDNKYADWPLWEVVNASSSAPIYFDPSQVHGRLENFGADGGLFANNPAMCGYVEARKAFETEDIFVASFGCGQRTLKFPTDKHWGLLRWAVFGDRPLIEAMFDGQSQTVAYQMDHLLRDRLVRFQFSLDDCPDVPLDAANREAMRTIEAAALAYLETQEGDDQMARLIEALRPLPEPPDARS